jgi:hypothetical protein
MARMRLGCVQRLPSIVMSMSRRFRSEYSCLRVISKDERLYPYANDSVDAR